MSTPAGQFTLRVEQVRDFEFRVRFDNENYSDLHLDEPPPLGHDAAPNPARILAAAIGDCLSASLLFCARRAKLVVTGMVAEVAVTLVRNDRKRLRIGTIDVRLHPALAESCQSFADCIDAFEDFCVVTQSVREGLDVRVSVEPVYATAAASLPA